jgi:glutathione-regulated potassium-efflux system ancillary protein KefG
MEMAKAARTVKGVTFIDLYELYPDFDIDIKREQQLLLNHDLVIWQHPFYWYSAPPILKQWQDLVLEHGWAYGKSGNALKGKKILNAISSGGGMDAYTEQGYNRFSLHDFLKPYDQTAYLCKMNYLPPFWVPGVHRMNMDMIRKYALQYKNILTALSKDIFSDEEIMQCNYLNDLIPISSIQ